MKQLLAAFLFALGLIYSSCKDVPSKVYCQGFVVKETVHTPNHEQISIKYTLYCNGKCPGGIDCKKEKTYNPPQQNGLIKMEWCGCDSLPTSCDVVLKTFNSNGRIIQQADCTKWDSCPVNSDSCIQNPSRSRVDTIFNTDRSVKEFQYKDTITCDCVSRVAQH